jgi:hypothetical protein
LPPQLTHTPFRTHRKITAGQAETITTLQTQLHYEQHNGNILKKAVTIQDEKLKASQATVASMQAQGKELIELVRRLETENYALKSHVQQFGNGAGGDSHFGGGGSRDVF